MKKMTVNFMSAQLVLALAVLLGVSSTAIAKQTLKDDFKPSYKAEKCDCIGFSDDIPTFLSDLKGAQGIDIYGEGTTRKEAQTEAQNMCVETYRNFASVSEQEDSKSISHSGCHMYKSTRDGDWVSI